MPQRFRPSLRQSYALYSSSLKSTSENEWSGRTPLHGPACHCTGTPICHRNTDAEETCRYLPVVDGDGIHRLAILADIGISDMIGTKEYYCSAGRDAPCTAVLDPSEFFLGRCTIDAEAIHKSTNAIDSEDPQWKTL